MRDQAKFLLTIGYAAGVLDHAENRDWLVDRINNGFLHKRYIQMLRDQLDDILERSSEPAP